MIDESKLAFIDTETGGLDIEHHPVWEVAVIVDGVEHCWQQWIRTGYIRPTIAVGSDDWWETLVERNIITQWVIDNTGIRERYDAESAITWIESAQRFAGLVAGRHLVGAVPNFDAERLARLIVGAHVARTDDWAGELPWHHHLIDVETLAVGWLSGYHGEAFSEPLPWSSRSLSRMIGVDPDLFGDAHQALNDARWARAMFTACMKGVS